MEGGRHALFIWSAYGVTAAVLLGLIGRAFLDYRAQKRTLAALEARADPRSRKRAED